ncbi:PEPxxWA-CTERM sorting domain-containing protein [Sphingobium sp. DEHP117]|uniref:PEPxxWA-CTERM sorting domain-containing protein n=1 Tax=Sphingobium sp. DEHP117 TaxID=2993436 RepID=UPI0027D71C9B|nr:PEPxxWA-CTERM sorting domain-containing protein [Sphingobium sp. DEHP117]MDQ4419901.1 PEPxxWA-CTERM sorting domain-containing protein [Sphingobium sp. DEHP117]
MKAAKWASAAIAGAMMMAAPSHAKILVFNYSARVDQSGQGAPVGTLIAGSFSYDNNLQPHASYPGTYGDVGAYQSPTIRLSANISGSKISGGGTATVFDSHTPYSVNTPADEDSLFIGDFTGPLIGISIYGPNENWLNNTNLPSAFPFTLTQGHFPDPRDGDGLMVPAGELFYNDLKGYGFNAVVLSVTSAAVPEPATWSLLIIGFGGIGAAMRRRMKHAGALAGA